MEKSRGEDLVRRLRAGSTAQLSKPPRRSGTPSDPWLQVIIISDAHGALLEEPPIADTWERDGRGAHPRAVAEALEPDALDIDPLNFM